MTGYRITVDTSRVENWMRKIPQNIRKRGRIGLKRWGNSIVVHLLRSANSAGINQFRKNRSMFTNTRYVQKGDFGYVFMPKSGLYQDRAKPHYVTITRNKPLLYAWARQKGFTGRGFYFTPRPFIRKGLQNSMKQLMPIMRPQVMAAIRESN